MFIFGSVVVNGQVRDIKDNVKTDQKSSQSSRGGNNNDSGLNSDGCDTGVGLAFELMRILFVGTYQVASTAQHAALMNVDLHPDQVGFEGSLITGPDFHRQSQNYQFNLRFNRGIFATDIRYHQLEDVTGQLQSLDWQVLMLRLPIDNIKLEYGVGFTHLYEPGATYFESSIGADWRLANQRVNVKTHYRWTQTTNLNSRYRQEWSCFADYKINQTSRWFICPLVGITYQNYFQQTEMWLIQGGVTIRWQ